MALNGRLNTKNLTALPARWSNKGEVEYLRDDAAASLSRALSRAVAESGENFQLFDAYRSLTEQVSILKTYYYPVSGGRRSGDRSYKGVTYRKRSGSPAAASPGHSNHGTGIAIDIHHGGVQGWFKTSGRRYGWTWDEGRRLGESWHFVYDPDLDRHKSEGFLDHAAVQKAVGAEVDGKIGTGTVAKIRAKQAALGLEVDGKVGPATKRALGLGGSTAPAAPSPAPAPKPVAAATEYTIERHQTKNLRVDRIDEKRGLVGELNALTLHHWGGDGQRFENVVGWLVADGNGNNSSSAHEVIEGSRVAVLADIKDGTWNSGSAQGNLDNYAFECRPEADEETIRTVAARVAWAREESGKDLPLNLHKDYTATACPGRWEALRDTVDALSRGELVAVPKPVVRPTTTKRIAKLKVDGRFGKTTVTALQIFLVSRGYTLKIDGKAGHATWRAFQAYLRTPVDGVVSRQSYRAKELGNGITQGWDYTGRGSDGSTMVEALQVWVGANPDGIWFESTSAGLQEKLNVHAVGM